MKINKFFKELEKLGVCEITVPPNFMGFLRCNADSCLTKEQLTEVRETGYIGKTGNIKIFIDSKISDGFMELLVANYKKVLK